MAEATTAATAPSAAVTAEPAVPEWKHPVYPATDKYTPGIAPIKPEFLLPKPTHVAVGSAKHTFVYSRSPLFSFLDTESGLGASIIWVLVNMEHFLV